MFQHVKPHDDVDSYNHHIHKYYKHKLIILYYSILIDSHCQLQNSNNSFYFQKYELAHCSNMKQLQSSLEVVLGTIK